MSWDSSKPADASAVLTGTAGIRDNWTALETTLDVDHNYMGETRDGQHEKVTLYEIAAPSAIANTGIVYTKDVSAATELFYIDAAGNEVQLTSGGSPSPTAGHVDAWINYNGLTQTITGSYNVASVTYVSAAVYTVNFTNALSADTYAVTGMSSEDPGQFNATLCRNNGDTKTVNACTVRVVKLDGGTADVAEAMAAFII